MPEREKKPADDSFEGLEIALGGLARNRAEKLTISEEDNLYLNALLYEVSSYGEIPEWAQEGPSEKEPDDYEMLIEGRIVHPVTEEYDPVYVQWGSKSCLNCIHIGMLGDNLTVFRKSRTVFSHEEKRHLDEKEISTLAKRIRACKWLLPEIKSSSEILKEEINNK